jgi:hypothetical protein
MCALCSVGFGDIPTVTVDRVVSPLSLLPYLPLVTVRDPLYNNPGQPWALGSPQATIRYVRSLR